MPNEDAKVDNFWDKELIKKIVKVFLYSLPALTLVYLSYLYVVQRNLNSACRLGFPCAPVAGIDLWTYQFILSLELYLLLIASIVALVNKNRIALSFMILLWLLIFILNQTGIIILRIYNFSDFREYLIFPLYYFGM